MKLNCWEFKKCGREPGGINAVEQGICPASTLTEFDCVNNGKNAGRICWMASGTLCSGITVGTFARNADSCMNCDFFARVSEEEGFDRSNSEIPKL